MDCPTYNLINIIKIINIMMEYCSMNSIPTD